LRHCGVKEFDTKFAKEREGRQGGLFWTFGLWTERAAPETPFVIFVLLRDLCVELAPEMPVFHWKAPPDEQEISVRRRILRF
jgi:hypothetical protein